MIPLIGSGLCQNIMGGIGVIAKAEESGCKLDELTFARQVHGQILRKNKKIAEERFLLCEPKAAAQPV